MHICQDNWLQTWKSLHPNMWVRLNANTEKLCTSCQTPPVNTLSEGLAGESGRDAATKCSFFNGVQLFQLCRFVSDLCDVDLS